MIFSCCWGATLSRIDDLSICPPNIILYLFCLLAIPYSCFKMSTMKIFALNCIKSPNQRVRPVGKQQKRDVSVLNNILYKFGTENLKNRAILYITWLPLHYIFYVFNNSENIEAFSIFRVCPFVYCS